MRIENKQGLGLNCFWPNSNGHGESVKELMEFSSRSWFSFETKEEALKFINNMKKEIDKIVLIKEKWPGDITAIRQRNNINKAKKIISQLIIR